ncbi:U6 snRNA phosphodiesterase isoform X2 [Hypomesus transpacificus]|uniref:U6 snRNA phosphodiesterase isoform X2 n=1 Tax=Hypomesus transpacificus TaxID=137520 RepID=UPI001F07F3FC|nr:U6 snRNA phosphodiesterase isoform X2 [Hypomesus transpacificus]
MMLVNYSSSSEDETEVLENAKRRQSCNNDDRLRKKHKPELEVPSHRNNCNDHESLSVTCTTAKRQESKMKSETTLSRLPLPDSLLDMFTGEGEDSDTENSSHHEGRIRSFKHERGNWATYVYFPYLPEEEFLELLDEMLALAAAHGVPLSRAQDFHLSMSQTVVLRHHWIQPFIQSLRTGLSDCRRLVCSAEKLRVYSNAEKTRTFLGMEVSSGHSQLLQIMKTVDGTMEEFRLDTFYKNPSFHVSLAWCAGDFTDCMRTCLQKLQGLVDCHEDGRFLLRVDCQELRCKSGNKIFSFPLVC